MSLLPLLDGLTVAQINGLLAAGLILLASRGLASSADLRLLAEVQAEMRVLAC